MPTLDLSLVTRTLVTTLDQAVRSSPAWPPGQTLDVVPRSPDQLEGSNTLGLYLYHVTEDAHFKNTYQPGLDDVPVAFTPMALNLHYILSAFSDLTEETGPYREQLMIGLAAKTLHDHPVIDDETVINGTQVMAPMLRGGRNILRVTLDPTPPERAVHYFTAGSTPLRLSLYYQVSVVMLQPEESQLSAGRVLRYGVYAFTTASPRVASSESIVVYTLPGETEPRAVEARPAQVTYGGEFALDGSGFGGAGVDLLLRRADWDETVLADSGWNVEYNATRLVAQVAATVDGIDIIPGIYAAAVRVTRYRTMPDGSSRAFTSVSNETPFAITPRIDSVSAPDANGNVTVTGTLYEHPDLDPATVQVYAGEDRLQAGSGALSAGEFEVTGPGTLNLRLPGGVAPVEPVPLRLIINGAEAAPAWILP